jgi:tetratricopeptide (TPR) repeat protein
MSRPWLSLLANVRAHPVWAGALVVCLFIISGVGYFIVYPQLAGVYHWRKAQQALEQYDFLRARSHLQQCLEVWPASGDTAFLLARTCRRAGDFAAAQTHLQEAEQMHWLPALTDLERLLLKAQAGMVQAVEPELRRYLAARPEEHTVIFEALVIGSWQANFLDDAYRWSTDWTEEHPDNYQAHFWRGRVLEKGLRYDLAAEEYQRVLEQKPDSAAAHLSLGEMLLRKGQYARALPHFQAGLPNSSLHAAALLGVARCQRYLSPPEVALATLEPLFAEQEPDAGVLSLRGQLELARGNAAEARLWLQRAERRLPPDLDTYQALTTACRLLNRVEEAQAYESKRQQLERDLRRMEELTKQIIDRPTDVALRSEAGITLLRLGQQQQGARWLMSALLLDPQNEPARKALADCLPMLGDPALVESYRRIVEQRSAAEVRR